jgi:hypothetical protein
VENFIPKLTEILSISENHATAQVVSTGFSLHRVGFSSMIVHVGFVMTVAMVAAAEVAKVVVILVVSLSL